MPRRISRKSPGRQRVSRRSNRRSNRRSKPRRQVGKSSRKTSPKRRYAGSDREYGMVLGTRLPEADITLQTLKKE